ncbi:winged helix-turn-helix domain-containing protein [Rheinheimera pleomorphica]|uniref:winged helix-turn-helix domain-containing protein n=1 Tax=Rheinheimera pleomorphica TaxID=2703963 RepID=UPI001423A097|nr:winged helix-turn-helix domain-containing protein [Rheinheimera pleomorphica]
MSNLDPVVQIGDWYYQVIYGQLWPVSAPSKTEQMVRLEPRLHSLLNFFLLHPNTLLAKDVLIEKVWPAEEGTDAAVMRAVGALRKVLGDDVKAPCYIATVSKKGYCWLADINTIPLAELQHFVAENSLVATEHEQAADVKERWPWRFISITAAVVFIVCASLAYVLATFTAAPLVKLPDTISPISALSGQEYWPVMNDLHSHVVYQHKAPDSNHYNLSLQQLADLRVEHLPQQYQQLSEPHWLDAQHIIFRGSSDDGHCQFYRQQVLPHAGMPTALWHCNKVMPQAMVRWNEQWLWLDSATDGNQLQLWLAKPDSVAQKLRSLNVSYRQLEHMVVRDDQLYLLAQETQHNTLLLQVNLPDGELQRLAAFPYTISQFSWWDNTQLLLASAEQELQLYDLKHGSMQSLGPLTRELTQARRYGAQVLATQFLDYTTDILRVTPAKEGYQLSPWHVSNRSERLVAVGQHGTAFISERAGFSQIWLAQGNASTQLSRLNEQQQVQQLLWHNQQLLVLINNRLYQQPLNSPELNLYPEQAANPGRYASCNNQLYWTDLTSDGWTLFTLQQNDVQPVLPGVVDVRCAPGQNLVVQFAADAELGLFTAAGEVQQLPVRIAWREQDAEQWFVDNSGIYWLTADKRNVLAYRWQPGDVQPLALPEAKPMLAIYSAGDGLGYVVRPRPHDTDIVWLQNRR